MTTTAVLPFLYGVDNTTIPNSNVANGSLPNFPNVTNATKEYGDVTSETTTHYDPTNNSVTTNTVTTQPLLHYTVTSAPINEYDITNATTEHYDITNTTSLLDYEITNGTLLYYDITNGTVNGTSSFHIVTNGTMHYDDISTLDSYVITTNSNVVDDGVLEIVTLASSVIAIVCYFCILGLLVGMGLAGIRSHIHSNVCVSLLTTHGLLLVGAQQIPGTTQCKVVSILTQFFILAGFTWLLLEGIQLFRLSMIGSQLTKSKPQRNIEPHNDRRKRSQDRPDSVTSQYPLRHQNDRVTSRKQSSEDEEVKVENRTMCCSRITSYYVIGWFFPAMFIGATIPSALNGYGLSENCWLANHDEVIWVFGAPVPAIFLFHFVVIILAIRNFKRKMKEEVDERRRDHISKQSSSKTTTSRFSSATTSSRSRGSSGRHHRPSAVSSVRTRTASCAVTLLDDVEEADDVIEQQEEFGSYESDEAHAHDYHVLDDHYGNGANDVVRIHPPLHEVNRRRFAVTLPDKNEGHEPPKNYLAAVYWQAWLVPLVCATWTCGLCAVNFRLVELEYTFCVMNILQAIYIFCYYCVVTFRLRQRWHIMASREINRDARPVTVLLGDDSDDAYDVINGKRMRARRRKKKIPNYDLLTRTPTPFGKKLHFRELDSSESSVVSSNPADGTNIKSSTNNVKMKNLNFSRENRQITTVNKQYRDNASNMTLQSQNSRNIDLAKSFQLPGFSGAKSGRNFRMDEAGLKSDVEKRKNVKIQPKIPLVKSVSDNDMLNKRQTLRQTNSVAMSASIGDLVDINSVISDQPFTDNLHQNRHTDSQTSTPSSNNNLLSYSETPPSMIESPHSSPVFPKYRNVVPVPRHATQRFAPITITKETPRIRAKNIQKAREK